MPAASISRRPGGAEGCEAGPARQDLYRQIRTGSCHVGAVGFERALATWPLPPNPGLSCDTLTEAVETKLPLLRPDVPRQGCALRAWILAADLWSERGAESYFLTVRPEEGNQRHLRLPTSVQDEPFSWEYHAVLAVPCAEGPSDGPVWHVVDPFSKAGRIQPLSTWLQKLPPMHRDRYSFWIQHGLEQDAATTEGDRRKLKELTD